MNIKQIVLDLCAMNDELEWFEFKENWFQPETLGAIKCKKKDNFDRNEG